MEETGVLLGIDGGGTKTAFLLINENGDILKQRRLLQYLTNNVGMDNSIALLKETVHEILNDRKRTFVSLFLTGESRKTVMVNFCPVLKK